MGQPVPWPIAQLLDPSPYCLSFLRLPSIFPPLLLAYLCTIVFLYLPTHLRPVLSSGTYPRGKRDSL